MRQWLRSIFDSGQLEAVGQLVHARGRCVVQGSQGSSSTLLAGLLSIKLNRPVLLVVAHLDDADDALDNLELFESGELRVKARRFGAMEVLPGETNVSLELLAERLEVIESLAWNEWPEGEGSRVPRPVSCAQEKKSGKEHPHPSPLPEGEGTRCGVLVAPVQALMQSVPEPGEIGRLSLTLKPGQSFGPAKLVEWLTNAGYQRTDGIENPGDYAVRGGIIDIYLPAGLPSDGAEAGGSGGVRVDYFGDDVDSIKRIDTSTLGSGSSLDKVQIVGASAQALLSDEKTTSLLALLPKDTVVVMSEVLELAEQARGYFERLTNPRGVYPPNVMFKELTAKAHVEVHQYTAVGSGATGDGPVVQFPVETLMTFDKEGAVAVDELVHLAFDDAGSKVVVICPKDSDKQRIGELLTEHFGKHPEQSACRGRISAEVGYLHRGFVWVEKEGSGFGVQGSGEEGSRPASNVLRPASSEDENGGLISSGGGPHPSPLPEGEGAGVGKARKIKASTKRLLNHYGRKAPQPAPVRHKSLKVDHGANPVTVLVPHQELFHRYHTRRRIRRLATAVAGTKASDAFLELSPGDYVVHVDHGIARFSGLKTLKRGEQSSEHMTLEFAERAVLHVPVTEIDRVQKYVGGHHGHPPLSTLGGKRWAKQKSEAAEAAKELAQQMLRVQAMRASTPGIRFPEDTPWQKEFEASFGYDETPDQVAAIAAVKRDMSDNRPMDRLICGDVGFGKTEVAIRAAFKAAQAGKQVAVLVPTTILAEQHERTFKSRMAEYPVRIDVLSRFRTPKEVKNALDRVKEGQSDIVIGTHRILSEDVQFKDLGLVIIDEEQRFGVEHKQKLMRFRATVDVLTLSATPIPRTLHMSMLGLRDISSLTTPPVDRRAVVTEVIAHDSQRIQRAILRELNRDGQVYFVHNRVHDIQSVADDIRQLVPDAKIIIGHGQMPGHELEEVMLKFVQRKADILVSTTIVESGLDIPTANTMFIDQADHFGLSELHQLRGRVGRDKHRAYCYLIMPKDRPVSDKGASRLRAIEQYAMLGAGFKVAMRDLEIRGAGNLLGAEQSGHIASVGYEMYCRLLEEAARDLRKERKEEPLRTHLELPLSGAVPKSWIASDKYRMEAYRRIARAVTMGELDEVVKDLTDAYGEPPGAAQVFIALAEIRLAAGTLRVKSIKLEGQDVIFRTDQPLVLDGIFTGAPGRTSLIDEKTIYFRPPANYLEPVTLAAVLRKLLVRPVRAREGGQL
jgi:transcription-repair coupling factor